MRLNLADGRWADVHDVRTHRIAMAVERAYYDARLDREAGRYPFDFMTAEILAYVTAWSEPFALTVEGLLDAPQDKLLELFEAVDKYDDEQRGTEVLPKDSPSESPPSDEPITPDPDSASTTPT